MNPRHAHPQATPIRATVARFPVVEYTAPARLLKPWAAICTGPDAPAGIIWCHSWPEAMQAAQLLLRNAYQLLEDEIHAERAERRSSIDHHPAGTQRGRHARKAAA